MKAGLFIDRQFFSAGLDFSGFYAKVEMLAVVKAESMGHFPPQIVPPSFKYATQHHRVFKLTDHGCRFIATVLLGEFVDIGKKRLVAAMRHE